jgi:hypothetical protein
MLMPFDKRDVLFTTELFYARNSTLNIYKIDTSREQQLLSSETHVQRVVAGALF